ncbi:MAG: hypothetical protein WCZ23_11425 [Rhodospirillaceae bacterium]
MTRFVAHRRQFVIAPRPEAQHDRFVHHDLACGLILSHCPDLPVVRATTKDGREAWLLGHAIATERDAPSPAETLAMTGDAGLADVLWSWSGRWALLWGDRLYPDAGAMLGLHYRVEDGVVTVASSPAYFLDRDPADRLNTYEPQFGAPILPGTAIAGVRKVLPSYSLSLRDGTLEPLPIAPPTKTDSAGHIDAFAELLGNALVDVGRQQGRINLGLSAGYDSRVLLALAAARGVEVTCTTFIKEANILARPGAPLPSFPWRHDREVPHRLAEAVGLPHQYVTPGPLDLATLREFDRHTGGGFADNERYYMAHGHVAALDNPVFLKGHGTEVAGANYLRFLPWSAGMSPQEFAGKVLPFLVNSGGVSERMLREWLAMEARAGVYGADADFKELFHVEQKRAGWLSNVYQGSDFGYDCLALSAGRKIFRALMSIPVAERQGYAVHRAVIARHAPALLDLPFNVKSDPTEKLRHLAYQVRLLNLSLPQKLKWKVAAYKNRGLHAH